MGVGGFLLVRYITTSTHCVCMRSGEEKGVIPTSACSARGRKDGWISSHGDEVWPVGGNVSRAGQSAVSDERHGGCDWC